MLTAPLIIWELDHQLVLEPKGYLISKKGGNFMTKGLQLDKVASWDERASHRRSLTTSSGRQQRAPAYGQRALVVGGNFTAGSRRRYNVLVSSRRTRPFTTQFSHKAGYMKSVDFFSYFVGEKETNASTRALHVLDINLFSILYIILSSF